MSKKQKCQGWARIGLRRFFLKEPRETPDEESTTEWLLAKLRGDREALRKLERCPTKN